MEKLKHRLVYVTCQEQKKKKVRFELQKCFDLQYVGFFFVINSSVHYTKGHIRDISNCLMTEGINKTINEWAIIYRSPSQKLNLLVCDFYASFGGFSVEERFTFPHHFAAIMMCSSWMLQSGNNAYSIFGSMNFQLQGTGLKFTIINHSQT